MSGCQDPSWFQDSWISAEISGRSTFIRVPQHGHHWAKLSHMEETSRDKLKTISQEEEDTEVRAVTFPERAGT